MHTDRRSRAQPTHASNQWFAGTNKFTFKPCNAMSHRLQGVYATKQHNYQHTALENISTHINKSQRARSASNRSQGCAHLLVHGASAANISDHNCLSVSSRCCFLPVYNQQYRLSLSLSLSLSLYVCSYTRITSTKLYVYTTSHTHTHTRSHSKYEDVLLTCVNYELLHDNIIYLQRYTRTRYNP